MKKVYSRLPIMILADGLYPYEGFFAMKAKNHLTLKSLWLDLIAAMLQWGEVDEQVV